MDSVEWQPIETATPIGLNRRGLEAAAEVMRSHGMDICLPWEGSLDDRERECFDGFCAAILAYMDARDAL